METLKKNITQLYAETGLNWLSDLPTIIKKLSADWQLSHIQPVQNMTYHYVAKALQDNQKAVALKIGLDEKAIHHEIKTLQHFSDHGMVKLLDYHSHYHAMLLQQAIPGESLRQFYPAKVDWVIAQYASIIHQFKSQPKVNQHEFQHVSDWLTILQRIQHEALPSDLLKKAITLKSMLLESSDEKYLLHGDLHHDNILSDGTKWLAIDPKGVVGEIAFEAAFFDFIHPSELQKNDIPMLFDQRAILLAKKLDLDPQRLKDWVFVRLMLSACWMIEDHGDPGLFLKLIQNIFLS